MRDQTVKLQPCVRGSSANEVVVGTDVVSKGEPIQLDYRLEKAGDTLEDLRLQRARRVGDRQLPQPVRADLSGGGVDGLIANLAERNKHRRHQELMRCSSTGAAMLVLPEV